MTCNTCRFVLKHFEKLKKMYFIVIHCLCLIHVSRFRYRTTLIEWTLTGCAGRCVLGKTSTEIACSSLMMTHLKSGVYLISSQRTGTPWS